MDYIYHNRPTKRQLFLRGTVNTVNRLMDFLNIPLELTNGINHHSDMITVEQRMNLYHLLLRTLHNNTPGDIVECGCYTGNSAVQIQDMLYANKSTKVLHLYDRFNEESDKFPSIKKQLIENFKSHNVQLPQIHEGNFEETIPVNLPDKISFAHIDCGSAADAKTHSEVVLYLLENIYPRMSDGAVCMLMDYHITDKTVRGVNSNPGVKMACDLFLQDKPEKVFILYGNQFSHGYFVKGISN